MIIMDAINRTTVYLTISLLTLLTTGSLNMYRKYHLLVIFFRNYILFILLFLTLYRLKSVIVSLNVIHVALDHLLV